MSTMKISVFEKLLVALTAFTLLLIGVRIYVYGNWTFAFMAVNLFLAWVPFGLSRWLVKIAGGWKRWVLFAVWLLFLPNAFYIVTDLVHLRTGRQAPLWYDVLLLFSSAVVGLIMAFESLYRVEQWLRQFLNNRQLFLVISSVFWLSAFGVYLGRYLRWYSWDIITQPLSLLETIWVRCFYPMQYLHTWGMTALFGCFFMLLYYLLKHMQVAILKHHSDVA